MSTYFKFLIHTVHFSYRRATHFWYTWNIFHTRCTFFKYMFLTVFEYRLNIYEIRLSYFNVKNIFYIVFLTTNIFWNAWFFLHSINIGSCYEHFSKFKNNNVSIVQNIFLNYSNIINKCYTHFLNGTKHFILNVMLIFWRHVNIFKLHKHFFTLKKHLNLWWTFLQI